MRVLVVLALLAGVAYAQPSGSSPSGAGPPGSTLGPSRDPAVALREANAAATAGDWGRVSATVQPLLALQLERADLAEAHRLAGIAAMFEQPPNYAAADEHFLAYLRIDLDGHLDPALYPPEVVNRFNDVRARHSAELKALRPQVRKRYAVLAVLPPLAQFQNGDTAKGIVIGGLLGTFAITNVTTYFVLRSWCFKQEGPMGSSIGCDGRNSPSTNHNSAATTLRALNIAAGVGLIATYVYGVYDGVRGYRRDTRERAILPYASSSNGTSLIGVHLKF